MKLDVGCGSLDYSDLGELVFLHGNDDNIIHLDIKKYAFHIETQGTVYNLPFKDNSFDVVYLRHVLEHLENPIMALKEIKRVAKKFIIIQIPNASYFKFKNESEEHLFSWNYSTLNHLLSKIFKNFKVYNTKKYNKKRGYIKKIIFAIACLFLKENELTAVCYID